MVKILGAAFAALLVCAHFADVQGDAYERPLSMFRDYDPAWIGYALFALLIAIGLETMRTAYRLRSGVDVAMYLLVTGLLITVVATPSTDPLHMTCALSAMSVLFLYFAVLLYLAESWFWLVMHLLMPNWFMMASRLESYGVWQKGMILYFLLAVIIHQSVLAQCLPKRRRKQGQRIKVAIGKQQAAWDSSI